MAALAEIRFVDSVESITFTGLPMPIVLRLPLPLSDQELIAFSRSIRPYRLERNATGELEIMSPNGLAGASLELYAGQMLGNWADIHGGVVISSQGGYALGGSTVRMADASWISAARWNGLCQKEREGFAPLSPDFLIEIRSKSDSRATLERKMEMWIESGASLAWLIDPYKKDVVVYRPGAEPQRIEKPDWVEADSVVPAFRLEMARMWLES